jgi:hypothetical protein
MLYLGKIIFGDDIYINKTINYILPLKIRLNQLENIKLNTLETTTLPLKLNIENKFKLNTLIENKLKINIKDTNKFALNLKVVED